MASLNLRSVRARGVSGLAALVIVCSGVGAVYATTNAPQAPVAGSGTTTGTATGTGTSTGSNRDRNGVVITQAPGSTQVAGFSKSGRTLYGTVIPRKATASKITKQFKPRRGHVKAVKHTLLVRGKAVGTFGIDKYGHLRFATAKAPKKGSKALVALKFTSKVKNARGKWIKKKLVVHVRTTITW